MAQSKYGRKSGITRDAVSLRRLYALWFYVKYGNVILAIYDLNQLATHFHWGLVSRSQFYRDINKATLYPASKYGCKVCFAFEEELIDALEEQYEKITLYINMMPQKEPLPSYYPTLILQLHFISLKMINLHSRFPTNVTLGRIDSKLRCHLSAHSSSVRTVSSGHRVQ